MWKWLSTVTSVCVHSSTYFIFRCRSSKKAGVHHCGRMVPLPSEPSCIHEKHKSIFWVLLHSQSPQRTHLALWRYPRWCRSRISGSPQHDLISRICGRVAGWGHPLVRVTLLHGGAPTQQGTPSGKHTSHLGFGRPTRVTGTPFIV